jgi:hypothetical protein
MRVAGDPEHLGQRDQLRPRSDLGQDRVERLVGLPVADVCDADRRRADGDRPDQAEVLAVGRDDLVAVAQAEPV